MATNASDLIKQQLGGVVNGVQTVLLVLGVVLIILGIVFAISGFFLYSKSKSEQKFRRAVGIILILLGLAGIFFGILYLAEAYLAPTIVNNIVTTSTNSYPYIYGIWKPLNSTIICPVDPYVYVYPDSGNVILVFSIEQLSGQDWKLVNLYFINSTTLQQPLSNNTFQQDRFKTSIAGGLKNNESAIDIWLPLFSNNISSTIINGTIFIQYQTSTGKWSGYEAAISLSFPKK